MQKTVDLQLQKIVSLQGKDTLQSVSITGILKADYETLKAAYDNTDVKEDRFKWEYEGVTYIVPVGLAKNLINYVEAESYFDTDPPPLKQEDYNGMLTLPEEPRV